MTPAVWDLPAQLRGRPLYRMTMYQTFDEESDHSEGVFIFAGWTFVWRIAEFAEERSVSLMLGHEAANRAASQFRCIITRSAPLVTLCESELYLSYDCETFEIETGTGASDGRDNRDRRYF
jgi:hypothetical protein